MICPSCQTNNENRNVFCNNCGTLLKDTEAMVGDTKSPTLSFQFPPEQPPHIEDSFTDEEETPTVFGGQGAAKIPPLTQIAQPNPQPPPQINPPPTQVFATTKPAENVQPTPPVFNPIIPPISPVSKPKSGKNLRLAIVAAVVFVGLAAIGVGGYFIISKLLTKTEILPQTVGMFVQSKDKDKVDEIKKQDFTNAVEAKDKLLKDEGLTKFETNQNLVLFTDEKDFKTSDLRLIQLDTIKSDGNLKQIDFQTESVADKTEVKRVKLPEHLANGKYAFAILEGFLDDGKHKFWAFQVTNSDKANNDSILKTSNVSLKSKDKKKGDKTPETPPTVDAYIYPKTNGVTLRSEPNLTANKVDILNSSDRLFVMKISDNTTTWRGITGYWANVKTDDGRTGWVFAPLLKR